MRCLCALLLWHPEEPIQENCHGRVKRNVHPQQPKVHPPLRVICPERGKELVCPAILAVPTVLTVTHCVGIEECTPVNAEIALHILGTGLVLRRSKRQDFVGGTMHGGTSKAGRKESSGEVCEWIHTVDKDPELWH